MNAISVTPTIRIEEAELQETFLLSSGPGGQNVNKVASAVELRLDVARSCSLPEDMKQRLRELAGRRMTKDGVLILLGRRFRDQYRNREDVRNRLTDLLIRAASAPKARHLTKPPPAAKRRLAEGKKARSKLKRLRSRDFDF